MKPIKLLTLLLMVFIQISALKINAQCPAIVTAYIQSQTNATCPSNGMLVVGSNANLVASAQYQFTVAPPGISLAAQASNVFTSLLAGNYTIKVSCGASSAVINTIITTTYVQLTGSTSITNTCVNFTKGGRVTVTVANGNPPYTYSLLKTTNANYADNLSVYSTNNIFNTTDSGTFQVRIKDACSNFITKTVVMEPSMSAIKMMPFYVIYDQPCVSGNVSLFFALQDLSNGDQNIGTISGGLKFDIYQKGIGCTRGALIRSETKNSTSDQTLVIPQNTSVYVRTTNICGDTASSCYYTPANTNFESYWNTMLTGCATAMAPNGYMNIIYDYAVYGTQPVTYSVIKLVGGAVVRNPTIDSASFNNLPYGNYVVVGVDACGKINKDTIYVPAVNEPAAFSGWTDLECISQTGTLHYRAFIDGFVADLKHAVVTITSGPSGVGSVGAWYSDLPVVEWFNLVPGNYTASIISPCANKVISFTIAPTSAVLIQSLNVTTQQACNNGGVVNGQLLFNGGGLVSYELFNNLNVLIATNTSGSFTGLPVGNYTLKAKIEIWSNCGIPPYYITKNGITIYPDGTPPQVTKKIGLICEDIDGVITTFGKAIIKHAGFAPFIIETKKIMESDVNYVLQTTNSVTSFTINGLLPYENYRVRVTDACGNTALTDVAIGKLQQLNATNALAPCAGTEYILSAPDFVDATYSWKLNGSEISTARELVFPSYSNANNGSYECTMLIGGGCVKRVFTSILTGTCGVLPIKLESISATPKDCNVAIVWNIAQETNANKYEIERSRNGNTFEKIGERAAVYNNVGGTYGFEDKAPITGVNYYRIKMLENDGTYNYSKIVTAKNSCDKDIKTISFYPNPIVNKTVSVKVNSMFGGNISISFISLTGQVIRKEKLILSIGNTFKEIKLNEITKGIYLVRVTDDNGIEISTQKVMVE